MITPNNSNNLFTASEYEPNPNSTMYWIDLTLNSRGNVIKTFDGKRWLPLNRAANVDQWAHISEIVKAAGINFSESEDKITFPSNASNHYFKGDDITDTIKTGDDKVYEQITSLWTKLNSLDQYVEEIDAFTSTADSVTLNAKLWSATDDDAVFTEKLAITQDLPIVDLSTTAGVMTSAQYKSLLDNDSTMSSQISALQSKVSALESEVQSLKNQYSSLNTQLGNLQTRIQILENKE